MTALTRREPRKRGYSYREGLTMMAAQAIGIDPYLAAEAGEDPKNALNLLRKALKTEDQQARAELLQDAQNELRYVDAAQHPELVNAISAKILAAQGRGGDSEIAHVTPGEMVLHPDQLSPRTRALILEDLKAQRADPQMRIVGQQITRKNPATNVAEFNFTTVPTGRWGKIHQFTLPSDRFTGVSLGGGGWDGTEATGLQDAQANALNRIIENSRPAQPGEVEGFLSKLTTEELAQFKRLLQDRLQATGVGGIAAGIAGLGGGLLMALPSAPALVAIGTGVAIIAAVSAIGVAAIALDTSILLNSIDRELEIRQ